MTRVGLVCPLPPCPSGPADWVSDSVDLLARHLDVVLLVEDPDRVRPDLRAAHDVRPVAARHDPSIDTVVYHLANNPHHAFVYRAALEGPRGICEVHDGSLHHLVNHLYEQDGDTAAYQAAGFDSHGEDGRDAVNLRRAYMRGALELFLYDLLAHVLRRHDGAIVHSEYARSLVALDAPDVPVWLARLHAPEIPARATKAEAGLPADRFVIGTFGYIAAPKRPLLVLDAFRRAVEAGVDAHLVYAGQDDTHGELPEAVAAAGLEDRVTITGFVEGDRFHSLLTAVDAVVSLRAPHAGETSATLAYALAAGRPTVVQDVGSWSEIPHTVVEHVPIDDDEVAGLADAFIRLATDPERCRRLGAAAQAYAAEVLSPDAYCAAVVAAVEASRTHSVAGPRRPAPVPRARRTSPDGVAWEAALDTLPDRLLRVLAPGCPAWVTATLRWAGHEVLPMPSPPSRGAAGTADAFLAPAPPPGPARRATLAAVNRLLGPAGLVVLATVDPRVSGRGLVADLEAAGFGVRSPRFDDPPADLWPPMRGSADLAPTHVVARKAGVPIVA